MSKVFIKPITISWAPRWDKDDKLFYVGPTWQAKVELLNRTDTIDLYGIRIQLGPIRISLGTFDIEETK